MRASEQRADFRRPARLIAALARRLPLRREDGQGIVEFALVIPFLIVILLFFIDAGRAWNAKDTVVHLSNEAVRYAAVNNLVAGGTCAQLEAEAAADGLPAPSGGTPWIQVDTSAGSGQVGDPVTVRFSTGFNWFVNGFLPISWFNGISNPSATSTMRLEQDYTGPSTC